MAELRIRTARHTVRVAAPPRRVYQLIAEVSSWPDEVLNGTSHREYNRARMQVRFRHDGARHPLASMGGLWLVIPKGSGCLVALDHYYRVVDDNPADVRWLAEAVDHTSVAMLSALRETATIGCSWPTPTSFDQLVPPALRRAHTG